MLDSNTKRCLNVKAIFDFRFSIFEFFIVLLCTIWTAVDEFMLF